MVSHHRFLLSRWTQVAYHEVRLAMLFAQQVILAAVFGYKDMTVIPFRTFTCPIKEPKTLPATSFRQLGFVMLDCFKEGAIMEVLSVLFLAYPTIQKLPRGAGCWRLARCFMLRGFMLRGWLGLCF